MGVKKENSFGLYSEVNSLKSTTGRLQKDFDSGRY